MRRTLTIGALALIMASCSETWKPGEEYRYLRTLSNPTREQFRRREALFIRESAAMRDFERALKERIPNPAIAHTAFEKIIKEYPDTEASEEAAGQLRTEKLWRN